MWKFSNLNSGYNHWPPDVGKQQFNPDSLVFPTYTNTISCFSRSSSTPYLPGFGVQRSPLNLDFDDSFYPLNSQVFKPSNGSFGQNISTPAKRFLVFDHSCHKKNPIFCYSANPFQTLNPTLPSSNASYGFASNLHISGVQEEMQEDTDEIDALLYSDSEFSFDSEEASTGHSPLNMNEVDVISSPIPAKRRKLNLDHSTIDESLVDTENSAKASNFPMTTLDDNADISHVYSGNSVDGGHQERIHNIINGLRKIIPGGEAMDAAALLDEAILYLNYLKLEAKSLDATTESI